MFFFVSPACVSHRHEHVTGMYVTHYYPLLPTITNYYHHHHHNHHHHHHHHHHYPPLPTCPLLPTTHHYPRLPTTTHRYPSVPTTTTSTTANHYYCC